MSSSSYIELKQLLFREGSLNDLFDEISSLLQDEQDAQSDLLSVFFTVSNQLICEMEKELYKADTDFKKIDDCLHQLKGSSSSIGAPRLTQACVDFIPSSENQNDIVEWRKRLNMLKGEYILLQYKLNTLLQLKNYEAAHATPAPAAAMGCSIGSISSPLPSWKR